MNSPAPEDTLSTPGLAPGQPESETPNSPEQDAAANAAVPPGRVALGVAYRGQNYHGWQSQPDGNTVQDKLEKALAEFVGLPRGEVVATVCAGRTDAGVHALNQVVHFDAPVAREIFSWVRGTNRYLPEDIAVQWAQNVEPGFHARNGARGRQYAFLVRESAVRPAIEAGLCGWVFRPLDVDAHARGRARADRRARLQLVPRRRTARRCRRSRRCAASRSTASATTGASTSRPVRSCTTWCAT